MTSNGNGPAVGPGAGNGGAAEHIELPDEGMSAEALKAMPDMRLRHRLIHAAAAVNRYNMQDGILPKTPSGGQPSGGQPSGGQPSGGQNGAANGNGPAPGNGGGNGNVGGGFGDIGGGSGGIGGFGGAGAASQPAVVRKIQWSPQLRLHATQLCGKALAEHAPRLFRRGNRLAVLSLPDASENIPKQGKELAVRKDLNLRRARLADAEDLKLQVDEAGILFETPSPGKPGAQGQKFRANHPPPDPLNQIIRNPAMCPARVLEGIACVPRMDAAGNFAAASLQDGYDPETRIFHDGVSRLELSVPSFPTSNDIHHAANVIMEPFRHYENYLGDDMARKQRWTGQVLTLDLTAVEQPFLDRIPIPVINGNAAGVGKGELCKAVVYTAYGVDGDIITAGEDETEFQKRVDSMLIEGAPAVIVDNLNNRTLQSDALASYITERRARIRRYGRKGDDFDVEGRSLIMVNGNGLVPAEDMVRRCFVVELASSDPFPATRRFPEGVALPSVIARRDRKRILEAVFTLMRWWRQKGMPASGKVLGSFEDWSVRVGDLVAALTGWHPAESIADNVRLDPFRQVETAAINAIADRFGVGMQFRSADVAAICEAVHAAQRNGGKYIIPADDLAIPLHPGLQAALAAEAAAEAALDAAKKSGAGGKMLGVLEKALKEAAGKKRDETVLAMVRQSRLDSGMLEAVKAVMRNGGTDSRTIGEWFQKIDGRVIDGKKVVRDMTAKRTPLIMIVHA